MTRRTQHPRWKRLHGGMTRTMTRSRSNRDRAEATRHRETYPRRTLCRKTRTATSSRSRVSYLSTKTIESPRPPRPPPSAYRALPEYLSPTCDPRATSPRSPSATPPPPPPRSSWRNPRSPSRSRPPPRLPSRTPCPPSPAGRADPFRRSSLISSPALSSTFCYVEKYSRCHKCCF